VPSDLARAGAAAARVVALLALAAAASQLPSVLRSALDAVEQGRPSAIERDIAPARSLGVPPEMLVRARQVIPPDASYAVVLGDAIPLDDTQRVGVPQLLRYWLAPRRFEDERDDADWVIAYGHSSETLGVSVADEIELASLINAVRVKR